MKANELRIGNLVSVSYATSGILRITEISKDRCEFYDDFNKFSSGTILPYVKPIPLTEEWLLKFGFVKEELTRFDTSKKESYPYQMLNGQIKIRNGVYFFKQGTLEIELPFVHTLQNAYFVLSGGREVELKPEP